ncbi:MAG TPA: arginine repressor [Clostridiales bacterium]|nr:arginine repressor [Clostridiales bacterium]
MKAERQNKILEIISNGDIETQEELVAALWKARFKVTQATISRDIKELRLVKIQSGSGAYKYAVSKKADAMNSDILLRIFRDTARSVEYAQNIIVIKTLSGGANAAAEAIDTLDFEGILGSIAGDNTIFIATVSAGASADIADRLHKILTPNA